MHWRPSGRYTRAPGARSSTTSKTLAVAFPGVHTDWVTDIKWIPELDALVTSSLDRTVKFLDVERHGQVRVGHRRALPPSWWWVDNGAQDPVRKKFTGHRKGVYSFDFCAGYKFMVSCGSSRRITAWDPFRCREINSLSGHMAAVQQVVVNEDKNQIISVAVDKTIKVRLCGAFVSPDQWLRARGRCGTSGTSGACRR